MDLSSTNFTWSFLEYFIPYAIVITSTSWSIRKNIYRKEKSLEKNTISTKFQGNSRIKPLKSRFQNIFQNRKTLRIFPRLLVFPGHVDTLELFIDSGLG